MKHRGLLIVVLTILTGCSDNLESTHNGPRLYVFDCGMIRLTSLAGFSIEDSETHIRDLAVPCYVVKHRKGILLWDGGLASETAKTPGWHGEGMLTILDRTLADQLQEIGLSMSSFDYVAFSHMHWDHIGVANEIQGATLLIQASEYKAAFADEVSTPGFVPELYKNLRDLDRRLLDGDHDVFGDGSVKIVSAPGHTPGHQVLYIDLKELGPIVLSGDLYHFALSRADRRVPSFNTNKDDTLRSMDRVDEILLETGATLWIEHELALFETLKLSPESYR